MLKITKGFICYCQDGKLGLITSERKSKGVYRGIHLLNPDFGKPWESKKPHIVGMIDLQTGNFKFPGEVKPLQLPNATIIKILQPHNYGIGIEAEEDED